MALYGNLCLCKEGWESCSSDFYWILHPFYSGVGGNMFGAGVIGIELYATQKNI